MQAELAQYETAFLAERNASLAASLRSSGHY